VRGLIEVTKNAYKIQFEDGNTDWATKYEVDFWRQIEDLGISDFTN